MGAPRGNDFLFAPLGAGISQVVGQLATVLHVEYPARLTFLLDWMKTVVGFDFLEGLECEFEHLRVAHLPLQTFHHHHAELPRVRRHRDRRVL